MLTSLGIQQEQLSRAKDRESGKLAKRKDSTTGTASPMGGASTQSPAGSAQATPTSSTSNLVEPRSKPMHIDGPTQTHAGAPSPGGPQTNQNITPNQSPYQQHGSVGGGSGSSGSSQPSPATHGRHMPPLAPSVIISSSAPVSSSSIVSVAPKRNC